MGDRLTQYEGRCPSFLQWFSPFERMNQMTVYLFYNSVSFRENTPELAWVYKAKDKLHTNLKSTLALSAFGHSYNSSCHEVIKMITPVKRFTNLVVKGTL